VQRGRGGGGGKRERERDLVCGLMWELVSLDPRYRVHIVPNKLYLSPLSWGARALEEEEVSKYVHIQINTNRKRERE
jgi:hypothetical protein